MFLKEKAVIKLYFGGKNMQTKSRLSKCLVVGIILLFIGIGKISSANLIKDSSYDSCGEAMLLRNNLLNSAWFISDATFGTLWKFTHHGSINLGEEPGTNGLAGGTWVPDNEYPWWAPEYWNDTNGSAIWRINPEGDYERVTADCGANLTCLEFDPANGLLYGCDDDALYTIDMATGDAVLVGLMPGHVFIAIGISYEGQGYGIDISTDSLYRINLTDASTELVGPLGIYINYAQDCSFDYEANPEVFYLAAYTSEGQLYTINLTTGFATLVGIFQGGDEITTFVISYRNQDPVADFIWTPTYPHAGETVYFNASGSYDPDGSLEWYDWDWNNDGIYEESTSGPFISHSWSFGGEIPVTLVVWDDLDGSAIKTKIITVSGNNPPNITGPHYGKTNTSYTFFLGPITEDHFYSLWDWGDGSSSEWLGPYISGVAVNASHAWSEPGTYTIKVKLKDTNGTESNWSAPFFITIVQLKPAFFLGSFDSFNQTADLLIMEGRTFIVFPSLPIFHKGETIVISKNYLGHVGTSFILGIGGTAIL